MIMLCKECENQMEFVGEEFNDDLRVFEDHFTCFDCDVYATTKAENQEENRENPYGEVEEENCRHLIYN